MNTPTDFLEGIHAVLEKLPEDLAASLDYKQADLPDFVMPSGIEMGPADLGPGQPTVAPPMESYPDFRQPGGTMPDFPSQAAYSLSEADFPSFTPPESSEASEMAFPSLAGFDMSASSLPSGQAEYDSDSVMIGHLEDISRGIANLGRGGGSSANTGGRSQGPESVRGNSFYVNDPEADEQFASASPSINKGSTAGLRGAGGYGYGSRYNRQGSSLHGHGPIEHSFDHGPG